MSALGLGGVGVKGEATHSFVQQTLSTHSVPGTDLAAVPVAVNRTGLTELSYYWMFKRHVMYPTQKGDWVDLGGERGKQREREGRRRKRVQRERERGSREREWGIGAGEGEIFEKESRALIQCSLTLRARK